MNAYTMVTEKILSMMENGIIPWRKPWTGGMNRAWSGSDGHAYSFLNQIMLEGVAGEYITFNEAKKRGGSVRRGEKGHKVYFYTMVTPKEDQGKPEEEQRHIPFLSVSTVFHVAQCDGVEQKFHNDGAYEFTENAMAQQIADAYIQRAGLAYCPANVDQAYYDPAADRVLTPQTTQFADSGEYYSTLFHELIHSTGHKTRLDRLDGHRDIEKYSLEELVAEIGAASLCATCGIETPMENSVAYIQNWMKALRNDPKMIVIAAARAEKAVRYILGLE